MDRSWQSIVAKWPMAVALGLCGFLATHSVTAQSEYHPTPENLQARHDYQDMKFGMFIHWGVYSVLGDGEWVFHERHLCLLYTSPSPRD